MVVPALARAVLSPERKRRPSFLPRSTYPKSLPAATNCELVGSLVSLQLLQISLSAAGVWPEPRGRRRHRSYVRFANLSVVSEHESILDIIIIK